VVHIYIYETDHNLRQVSYFMITNLFITSQKICFMVTYLGWAIYDPKLGMCFTVPTLESKSTTMNLSNYKVSAN